jgi:D-3-phosphoglycerate dehydrogenase
VTPRLLITESVGFSTAAVVRLGEVAKVTLADLDRPGLLAAVRDVEVLWVRLRHRIDAEVIAAGPALKIIASPTTGLDHIDLAAAEARGIRVVSLRGETEFLRDVRATAELTIGLLLALLRQIPAATRDVEAGRWNRDAFKGHEIRGKIVGIVGYGRLGHLVAGYLRAFGATVIASDPHGQADDGVSLVELPELLRRADIVTIHVNLSDETRGLMGAGEIAQMKPGALLLNTSRGELVDEAALLAALSSGRLGGAALDVIVGESAGGVSELPLVTYARFHRELLITPHIGGCTHESMEQTEVFLAERVASALRES